MSGALKRLGAFFVDQRIDVLLIREDDTCMVNRAAPISGGRYLVTTHYDAQYDQKTALMLNGDGTIAHGASVNAYSKPFVKWEKL